MSDLKKLFEEKPTTFVHGKKDPTQIDLEERGERVFSFNPVNGWKIKRLELNDGNLSITIGKDKPLTWDDFTF